MADRLRASWGVKQTHRGTPNGVTGVVTDYDEGLEPIMAALQNEVGSDIGHTIYDQKRSISMTIQCKSNSELPAADSLITVGGIQCYVDRANITENNQSYMKFAVSASRFRHAPVADTPDIWPNA